MPRAADRGNWMTEVTCSYSFRFAMVVVIRAITRAVEPDAVNAVV